MDVEGLLGELGTYPLCDPNQHLLLTTCPDFAWIKYRVNISDFDTHINNAVIFTRVYLQHVCSMRRDILSGKTNHAITIRDINRNPQVAWNNSDGHGQPGRGEHYEVDTMFLNYVELSPRYDLHPGSPALKLLKTYASDPQQEHMPTPVVPSRSDTRRMIFKRAKLFRLLAAWKRRSAKQALRKPLGQEETTTPTSIEISSDRRTKHIPCPVVLSRRVVKDNADHMDPIIMTTWRDKLSAVVSAWNRSSAKCQLQDFFALKATSSALIDKIICIGLGPFDDMYNYGDISYFTQYCAAVTIADALNALNPQARRVEIILQDPKYTRVDHMLLPLLQYFPLPSIVGNPEALARIDQRTLVFSPFVPVTVPVLQICADVVLPEGPAGIFNDEIQLHEKQRWYSVHDRTSPRVVKLLGGYERYVFGEREWEMDEEVTSVTNSMCGYWLNRMDLFLRPAN
jgi:hypothetical protein